MDKSFASLISAPRYKSFPYKLTKAKWTPHGREVLEGIEDPMIIGKRILEALSFELHMSENDVYGTFHRLTPMGEEFPIFLGVKFYPTYCEITRWNPLDREKIKEVRLSMKDRGWERFWDEMRKVQGEEA